MTLAEWGQFAPLIKDIVTRVFAPRHKLTSHQRETLQRTRDAFYATEKYQRWRAEGNPQDADRELDIAALWETAADYVLEYDDMLAARLSKKSHFWRQGGTWSDQQVADAKIQLKHVRTECAVLFKT